MNDANFSQVDFRNYPITKLSMVHFEQNYLCNTLSFLRHTQENEVCDLGKTEGETLLLTRSKWDSSLRGLRSE